MDRGDQTEAKRIVEYARSEWQVVHDMYVNWSWAFFSYIAQTYGEAELEKAMRGVLGSYYRARYDKVMAAEVKTQVQLSVEGAAGAPDGAGPAGRDRSDGRAGALQAHAGAVRLGRTRGSGSRAARSPGPIFSPISRQAWPWTWGKEKVCLYCAHCAMVNEVMAIEAYGHPMRVTEYPEGGLGSLRLVHLQGSCPYSRRILRTRRENASPERPSPPAGNRTHDLRQFHARLVDAAHGPPGRAISL